MTSEVHSTRAGPALRNLAEADPAIAALSLWCVHRDGLQTATRGETITYGPEFERMPLHEQMGLAAHHILHVALRHSQRAAALEDRLGGTFDAQTFNLAADALINDVVLQGAHALPRPAVLARELIKTVLSKEISPSQVLGEWDAERLYFALMAEGGDGKGREGDARNFAKAHDFEADLDKESGSPDEGDKVQDSARWRQHLTRAMEAGRASGRGIGQIGYRLADIAEPRLAWEMLLRRLLSHAVMRMPRPTPHRPSRRWIAAAALAQRAARPTPAFQPGTQPMTDIPRIAIGLDASSSIDDAQLALFWSEVSGIARRLRAEIHLFVFDDEIRHRQTLDPTAARLTVPQLPRGGGTAFIPVIEAAQRIGASALVMFTDLEGDAGPAPRGLSVIWALGQPPVVPVPFGHLIDMSR